MNEIEDGDEDDAGYCYEYDDGDDVYDFQDLVFGVLLHLFQY